MKHAVPLLVVLVLLGPGAAVAGQAGDIIYLEHGGEGQTSTTLEAGKRYALSLHGAFRLQGLRPPDSNGNRESFVNIIDPFYTCLEATCKDRLPERNIEVHYTDLPSADVSLCELSSTCVANTKFDANHNYRLLLDRVARDGQLRWTALNSGSSSDDPSWTWSGQWQIAIEEVDEDQYVGFKLNQVLKVDGVTAIATVGRGRFRLRDRITKEEIREGGRGISTIAPTGTIELVHGHVAAHGDPKYRLHLRLGRGRYEIKVEDIAGRRAVVELIHVAAVVRRSSVPACPAGSDARVTMRGRRGGKDSVGIQVGCEGHDKAEYLRDGVRTKDGGHSSVKLEIDSPQFD